MLRILEVPQEFLPAMPIQYPPHQGNNPMIEHRCFDYFMANMNEIETDYIYLPIQWTAFHLLNGYGQNVEPLVKYYQGVIEKFPNEKFFTIVQYDGGTLVALDNCKVFASSGSFNSPIGKNSFYEPIPLLCDPHSYEPKEDKKYKVVFCGRRTHDLRELMFNKFSDLDGYKMYDNSTMAISGDQVEIFKDLITDSIFGLCPRGYGPASFRMYETMQMGCIPIYVSDEFWLPFSDLIDWERAALLITPEKILDIPKLVDELIASGKWVDMLEYGKRCYEEHLSWSGTIKTIRRVVENTR
jgi:hypothetical protein